MTTLYQKDKVSSRGNFPFLDISKKGKNGQHSPMTIDKIRRENARWIASKVGGQAVFAARMELGDSRVSQLIGKKPTKNIGHSTARRIERVFMDELGLYEGWLDMPHTDQQPNLKIVSSNQEYNALLSAEEISRIVDLYARSTKIGRKQIMSAAEGAEKLPDSGGGLSSPRNES